MGKSHLESNRGIRAGPYRAHEIRTPGIFAVFPPGFKCPGGMRGTGKQLSVKTKLASSMLVVLVTMIQARRVIKVPSPAPEVAK